MCASEYDFDTKKIIQIKERGVKRLCGEKTDAERDRETEKQRQRQRQKRGQGDRDKDRESERKAIKKKQAGGWTCIQVDTPRQRHEDK